MRKVRVEDIGSFVFVDNPVISPDANKVAFIVTYTLIKEDRYESNIWLFNRKDRSLKQLTSGGSDYNPTWSPDGGNIAFLSKRDNETGIWVINSEGPGEVAQIYGGKGAIAQLSWSPDGENMLFLFRPETAEEVKEIESVPFWLNGEGFISHSPVQLLKLHVLSRKVEQLTDTPTDVGAFACSSKGDRIAFCEAHKDNFYICDIKVMDANGENVTEISSGFKVLVPPVWGPNDKYIVIQGNRYEKGTATHNNLWLLPVDSGGPRNLTANLEMNIGNSLYCDVRSRLSQGPVWQGEWIYFLLSEGGAVKLARLNVKSDKFEVIENENVGITTFSVRADYIVFSEGSDTPPLEIWEKTSGKREKVTHFNDSIMTDLLVAKPERFTFQANDCQEIEGWIMKPADFAPGKKYPAVLWIHGGPKSKFGYGIMHEFQLYSANGYAVIYVNPRGSDGYSEKFADIREHYGERDYKDIMESLDWIESNCSWIDPKRIGVTGISFGGFMTNWIVTHTDRFAAAISEEGISDQITMFGTTDIGPFFNKDAIGGEPWDNAEKYLEKSPLLKANQVKTPIMFIHALDDYRCGVDQSIQFFTALSCLGRKTKLLLFPNGGHIFGWTGRPKHRIKRLKYKLNWFNSFLKEKRM